MHKLLWIALAALALVALPAGAGAHTQGQCKVIITESTEGSLSLKLGVSEEDLLDLLSVSSLPEGAALEEALSRGLPGWLSVSAGESPCAVGLLSVSPYGMSAYDLGLEARCPVEASPRRLLWTAGRDVGLRLEALALYEGLGGEPVSATLSPGAAVWELPARAATGWESFGSFLLLGVEHILLGWDHLAFLLALLLACGTWRRAVLIASGFTVAHSVTLASGALGWVSAPSLWVEAVIAASIALAASLTLWRASRGQWSRPGAVAAEGSAWPELGLCFGFGLVHGLGFAGLLAEALPSGSPVGPLLGFNLGVELGQVACVAVAFPALAALGRTARGEVALRALLWGLVVLGVGVTIQRLVAG